MYQKFIFTIFLFSALGFTSQAQKIDSKKFDYYSLRSIGPGGMSGRVTAIAVVHKQPNIIYLGTASGGLWQSTGGGNVWKPLFDKQPVSSIGAIAINQSNPAEIWVGTGEGNPRNSQSSGNGVYKSIDGGKTWEHLGLENTRNIHRIFVHPQNNKVAYVGAIGSAWGDSPDRGVYRTQDGGKSWQKILYVNERTGVGDMVVDPSNPNKMIVALWEYRRWPWFFKSGGEGSGLYITLDGGDKWKKLKPKKNGIPKGELGRIGLAIAPSNPNHIYALIESKKNALYASLDGGDKWKKINDSDIGDRPFYYADLVVDSKNENRLYNIFSNIKVSDDGGKTFKTLLGWDRVHGDHHAWWIHPENPDFIIDGNDGGAAISYDKGKTWRFIENLPVGQFYHITVDMEQPYNVLGGMQDNGSWRGPNQVWRSGEVRSSYFEEISFGDGFDVVPDPTDSRYLYSMWQGGNLLYIDLNTGQQNYIQPTHPEGKKLRFHWNAGIAADPIEKGTIYYGSQYVHKTINKGETWEIISPDLTTNDPNKQKQEESGGLTYDVTNAENHTTIISIAPSPIKQGILWVGTDDGNIQLTQDGGKTWKNVADNLYTPTSKSKKSKKTPSIQAPPKGSWVAQVHASRFNEAEAFAVINDYRRNNWTPYLFRTTDYGQTWQPLVDKNKVWGYTLSFAQDLEVPNLMFLGTEFGLYVSFDAGENWNRWSDKYPTASTMDMVIHPREHDLVVGTFGRGIFILDDIRPLRVFSKDKSLINKSLYLFKPADALQVFYKQATGTRFSADVIYKGQNKKYGALLTYHLKAFLNDDGSPAKDKDKEIDTATIEVLNADNKIVRTFEVKPHLGFNRFNWGLDKDGIRYPKTPKPKVKKPSGGSYGVFPGTYTVRMIYAQDTVSAEVKVLLDPRIEFNKGDLKTQYKMLDKFEKLVKVSTKAADRLREADKIITKIEGMAGKKSDKAFKELNTKIKEQLKTLRELYYPDKSIQGIFRSSKFIHGELQNASYRLLSIKDKPQQTQINILKKIEGQVKTGLEKVNAFFEKDWKAYREQVDKLELSLFKDYESLE